MAASYQAHSVSLPNCCVSLHNCKDAFSCTLLHCTVHHFVQGSVHLEKMPSLDGIYLSGSPQARDQLPWRHMQVSMNALVEGKGRKDASRWFFEMLVLKTRNYVSLKQEEPYGDISIAATSKLLTAS